MRQLSLTLETSLIQLFPTFRDVVVASVHGCGRQLKAIAADLDMSPSELSRKLADNPKDLVHFPYEKLPALIEATGDKRPVLWLVEKFLDDPVAKRQSAVDRLDKLLPEIAALVKEARAAPETGTVRSIK
jgi:hypothetical protein